MANKQLGFEEARLILQNYGIPVLGRVARSREEALEAAREAGYPVVIKSAAQDIIHKTDVGVVLLDIKDEAEAAQSYDKIVENARLAGASQGEVVLVQTMADRGLEMLIGAKQDPGFGPVTVVGHGGRFVELWKDTASGVGVLSPEDVEAMLSKTLADKVLKGFRGKPLDRGAVIDLTMRVSRLMDERPDIHELDLNPVIVYEQGFAVVDSRLIKGEPITHCRETDLSKRRLKSLESIFSPDSMAVVGASRPGTIGGIILKNSRQIKKLYPINPHRKVLQGLTCYASLNDLPEVPDLAVFAVPAEDAVAGFRQFCEMGGRGAIIVSDGFAESGRTDLEEELIRTAEEHKVVYIGPNGLGVIDNFSGVNTLFVPERRTSMQSKPSGIGIISQSGGIGMELLEMLSWDNLSVGKWVSCGNASGITIPELLEHMGADERIKVIAIYIEGLRNGRQFMEVGRKVSERKPVIVIKGGVSGGAAATMSHTASLAGSFQAFKAACEQAGFFLIEELTEDPKILINVLSILSTQPPTQGNRVGLVSVGGGAGILLADQVTEEGMVLAEFTAETKERFGRILESKIRATNPEERERIQRRITSNPLDLFGDCDDDLLLESLRILNDDANTDIILVGCYFQVPYLSEYIPERLLDLAQEIRKPLILSPRGYSRYVWDTRNYLNSKSFQTYTVPMLKPLSLALKIWKRYGPLGGLQG